MSREQGPRAAGMRPAAIAARPPTARVFESNQGLGGGGMSREQGPRAAGMRPAAIAAGRRQRDCAMSPDDSEAAA